MMTRDEHMAFCKRRALEYIALGDPSNAIASMLSDLGKHPETAPLLDGPLGMMGIMSANSAREAKKFIEGFN